MTRLLTPIILIGIAVTGFFMFANPFYAEINTLRAQVKSYNEALDNSKALENERDKLVKKYNSLAPEDLAKFEKLLPDHVDNIRLILEIEKIALPHGMVLKDVKYDAESAKEGNDSANPGQIAGIAREENNDFGTWNLEFSTTGTYSNFIKFIGDIEKNLRIVDIVSIDFSAGSGNLSSSETYTYNFKIKTYWLKN